jgi:RNA polymerase sigma factor (TIGR02999 family)
MSDFTQILRQLEAGEPKAAEQLLPLVYDELRKLAAARLSNEKPGQTLQATALVHEAYMRLAGNGAVDQRWNGKSHFFAAAAEAMRRILIDTARRKGSAKHGGQVNEYSLDSLIEVSECRAEELLSLDAALEKLQAESPKKAELVKLRYFVGLTHQEAAQTLGISRATADRYWSYARAFLRCEMEDLSDRQS